MDQREQRNDGVEGAGFEVDLGHVALDE